jgi:hypothetical protein
MLMLPRDRVRPAFSPDHAVLSNSTVTISGQMASPTAHGSLHRDNRGMSMLNSRSKGYPTISQNYRAREGWGQ